VHSIVTGQEIKNNHTTANLYNHQDVSHFILLPSFETYTGIFFSPLASTLSRSAYTFVTLSFHEAT